MEARRVPAMPATKRRATPAAVSQYRTWAEERMAGKRCLRSGNNHTCLTDSQWAKLFGRTRKEPIRYGCGSYACVYQSRNKGKVIKLTTDPGDVYTTMKAQGLPGVVTLFRALEILDAAPDGGTRRWAMELERLQPVDGRGAIGVGDALSCAVERRTAEPRVCCRRQMLYQRIHSRLAPLRSCLNLVRAMRETRTGLQSRGLEFFDWHAGNIGRNSKGQWKLLDLGYNVRYVEPRPLLKGARRR